MLIERPRVMHPTVGVGQEIIIVIWLRSERRGDRVNSRISDRSRRQPAILIRVIRGIDLKIGRSRTRTPALRNIIDRRVGLEANAVAKALQEYIRDKATVSRLRDLPLDDRREHYHLIQRPTASGDLIAEYGRQL